MTSYGLGRRDALLLCALVVCVAALVAGLALVAGRGTTHAAPAHAPLPSTTAAAGRGPSTGPTDAPLPAATSSGSPTGSAGRIRPVRRVALGRSSLAIPALSVTASIVGAPVVDGVLEPPVAERQVGLWDGSAGLGADGGTVTIAGHVNWAGMGPFAFGRLAALHPGDRLYTTDAAGTEQGWRVTSVSARSKSSGVDTAAFAGSSGPRTLVLVTCGGTYDAGARSYESNVYVWAVPASVRAR